MQIGFINIHPLSVPFGNELAFTIAGAYNQLMLLYVGYIKPELSQIIEVLDLL